MSSVSLRDCSIGRRYAIDFPEPVSDARKYCPQPGRFSGGFWRSHFIERDCIGVGFGDGPSISVKDPSMPGNNGGEVNAVGSWPSVGGVFPLALEETVTDAEGQKNSSIAKSSFPEEGERFLRSKVCGLVVECLSNFRVSFLSSLLCIGGSTFTTLGLLLSGKGFKPLCGTSSRVKMGLGGVTFRDVRFPRRKWVW